MSFTISDVERRLIRRIAETGIHEIWIYKSNPYVSNVTLELLDGEHVMLIPEDRHVEGRFEVFVITLKEGRFDHQPTKKLESKRYSNIERISIISKCEWEVPTSKEDKKMLIGNPEGATTVFSGLEQDIPSNSLRSKKFDAGFKFDFEFGEPFYVLSNNPYELVVNDLLSNEEIDMSICDFRIEYE